MGAGAARTRPRHATPSADQYPSFPPRSSDEHVAFLRRSVNLCFYFGTDAPWTLAPFGTPPLPDRWVFECGRTGGWVGPLETVAWPPNYLNRDYLRPSPAISEDVNFKTQSSENGISRKLNIVSIVNSTINLFVVSQSRSCTSLTAVLLFELVKPSFETNSWYIFG